MQFRLFLLASFIIGRHNNHNNYTCRQARERQEKEMMRQIQHQLELESRQRKPQQVRQGRPGKGK